MGIASTVLRILSDFGDAAGWLIAAVVLFAYGRRIIRENDKAHAAITENVQENRRQIADLDQKIDTVATRVDQKIDTVAATLDKKIDTVAATLDKKIDGLGLKIDSIAKDVSFLAGRQAERDRT